MPVLKMLVLKMLKKKKKIYIYIYIYIYKHKLNQAKKALFSLWSLCLMKDYITNITGILFY